METIKIFDLIINKRIINQALIAKKCNLSQSYVCMLLNGSRKSEKHLRQIRNAIIKIYGAAIKVNKESFKMKRKTVKEF